MSPSTLHDGLEALRTDRAHEPAASSAVSRLASEFGTPLYVYDRETLVSQVRSLRAACASRFPKLRIHYALKANGNGALLAVLRAEGAAPEVVSLGEIVMALRAGWAGDEILFTSSSKGPEEIAKAVEIGAVLNVDSRDELEQAATSAAAAGKRVRISFRINPGVDPHTLHHINTGIPEAKFGLHLDGGLARAAYARARELPSVAITGIHCHIGSQIMEPDGYVATARKMLAFVRELKRDFGLSLEFDAPAGPLARARTLLRRPLGFPRDAREFRQDDHGQDLRERERGIEHAPSPRDVRRAPPRARRGRLGGARDPRRRGRRLRDRRHPGRRAPPPAAPGRGLRSLSRRGRLRLRDGVDIQRPAASGRGSRRRRYGDAHPPPRDVRGPVPGRDEMMQHKTLRLTAVLAASALFASCSGGNPFPPVTVDFGQLTADPPRAISLPLDEKIGQPFVVSARGLS